MPGRIPQEFINDLLQRVDIVEFIGDRLELKKRGKNYFGLCPFHGEKTASFCINPDRQTYHCFGCDVNGTAITFLMEYDNLEFVTAVETLAARIGVNVPREGGPVRKRPQNDRLFEMLTAAERYYRRQLKTHSDAERAQNYLKGRGITGEMAAAFGIGFAPPGWDNLKAQLVDESVLLQAGLLSRNENGRTYDRFRDRIVFPIRDSRGRVIGFGGRVIDEGEPKYLNSPETPVFQKGRELYGFYEARRFTRKLERLLLVEGYMDVIALSQHGITDVVATLGTATSAIHFEKLFRAVPSAVCCFDGDEAGRRAAWKALTIALPLMRDGIELSFLLLPEGEDPDSLVRRESEREFRRRLDKATPLSEFFFDHIIEDLGGDSLEGKARLSKGATALLKTMPKGMLKDLMYRRLAEISTVEAAGLDGYEPRAPPRQSRRGNQRSRGRVARLVERTLALLLRFPTFAHDVQASEMEDLATLQGEDELLLSEALRFARGNPELSSAALHGHFAADRDAQGRVAALSLLEFPLTLEAHRAEFRDGIDALLDAALVGIPRREALSRLREEDSIEHLREYLALRVAGRDPSLSEEAREREEARDSDAEEIPRDESLEAPQPTSGIKAPTSEDRGP